MTEIYRYLAENGCPDSQVRLALRLLDEWHREVDANADDVDLRRQPVDIKCRLAIDWLVEAAHGGNRSAIDVLEQCFMDGIGITDDNKLGVLRCLSRTELDIKADQLTGDIMNAVITAAADDRPNNPLSVDQFRQRLRRLVNDRPMNGIVNGFMVTTDDVLVSPSSAARVDKRYVHLNVSQLLRHRSPDIDLTVDPKPPIVDHQKTAKCFRHIFNLLKSMFTSVDLVVIISLLTLFSVSLIFNYLYFRPTARLMCRNLMSVPTVLLVLQALEVLAYGQIIQSVDKYNNYRLWIQVVKIYDKNFQRNDWQYFRSTTVWLLVFTISFILTTASVGQDTTGTVIGSLNTSISRQLMSWLSFSVQFKYNSNLLQLFAVIYHYLSINYCEYSFMTTETYMSSVPVNPTILAIAIIILVTTKPLFNLRTFYLILIPNLMTHLLIHNSGSYDIPDYTMTSICGYITSEWKLLLFMIIDIYEIHMDYDFIHSSGILLRAKCETCWDDTVIKLQDIYELHMIYDFIHSSGILLRAKCETCWDDTVIKLQDIYELHMIYDFIHSSGILLRAKCETCWDDTVVWHNC
ncbi:wolframin-like [Oppia nitens]|uniref:wolframin-like n=1 Tax=Oppia nitens TaxID=1686743 RepID=UPI0023DC6C8E|nr:wolframin-like [Oppia nitens]